MKTTDVSEQHVSCGSPPFEEMRAPSVLACGWWLFVAKLGLRAVGLREVLRWVRARTSGVATVEGGSRAVIDRSQYAVAFAAAFYPGRALCLEQSLVLYFLLRRKGVPADLRFGVKPSPFEAHAWVEYAGEPINDFAEHVGHFLPLPELPA